MGAESNAARAVAPRRMEVIRRHKEAGGKVAAVFPVHAPRALLRAFGVLPVEVWGPPGTETTLGDAHLQAYVCSVARCGLSFLLSGRLDVADFVIVPHACDTLQGLASVLLDFLPPAQPVLPLYLPRYQGDAAVSFLAAELRALYERLAEATGQRPSDAELMECIQRETAADALLSKLSKARSRLPVSDREYYELVRAREFVPAEDLEAPVTAMLARQIDVQRDGVPIVLSGMVPEPMEILDVISEVGGVVVADDLACAGRRLYPAGRSKDPLRRMAERLLGGPPDSTLGSPVEARVQHLETLVADSGARGVVFHVVKFCEPELFYLPQIRVALDSRGIRSVVVELDLSERLPHRVTTRLEALLETLA